MREYPYTKGKRGGEFNIVQPSRGEDGFEDPDPYKFHSVRPASYEVAPEFDFSSSPTMQSLENVLPEKLMSTVRALMRYAREKPSQKQAVYQQGDKYFEPERLAQQMISNYLTEKRPDILAMRGVNRYEMTDNPTGEDPQFFAQTNPYMQHYEARMPKDAISPDTYAGRMRPPPGMDFKDELFPPLRPLRFLSDGSMKLAGEPMDLAWTLLKNIMPTSPDDPMGTRAIDSMFCQVCKQGLSPMEPICQNCGTPNPMFGARNVMQDGNVHTAGQQSMIERARQAMEAQKRSEGQ